MRTEQNLKTMEVTILIGDMIYNKIIDKNDYSAYPNDKSKIISMLKSDAYLASIIKDNELSINIMGTTIQVEVLKKQMDKCLVCEKEYTKVKSWQKYCSKECKINVQKALQKKWPYGYSDSIIFINDVEYTEIPRYSYNSKELILVITYSEYEKIKGLDKEQDIKILIWDGGEPKIIKWATVINEDVEVTSVKGEAIMAKLTYKILPNKARNTIWGLEKNDNDSWEIVYID